MSSKSKRRHAHPSEAWSKAKAHADFIVEMLPGPNQEFHRSDLPEWAQRKIKGLQRSGVLEHGTKSRPDSSSILWTWELKEDFWDEAQEMVNERDPICPCGHSGVSNEGTHFVCGFRGCDETFQREELNE